MDAPHHMRANESCDYREGVTLSSNAEIGTLVDCGLLKVYELIIKLNVHAL